MQDQPTGPLRPHARRQAFDFAVKVARADLANFFMLHHRHLHGFMVTGKNSSGVLINPGQTISRMDALRLYTAENGWFFHEEDKVGSIEVGKLADLAVLSGDYFDAAKVTDEGIKKLHSVLTVVDGKVVYQ